MNRIGRWVKVAVIGTIVSGLGIAIILAIPLLLARIGIIESSFGSPKDCDHAVEFDLLQGYVVNQTNSNPVVGATVFVEFVGDERDFCAENISYLPVETDEAGYFQIHAPVKSDRNETVVIARLGDCKSSGEPYRNFNSKEAVELRPAQTIENTILLNCDDK